MWARATTRRTVAVALAVAVVLALPGSVPGGSAAPSDVGESTERVSVASDGTEGNEISASTSVSADGRFVAFASFADNLVSDDSNGVQDIFVRDRETGVTERVSVASDGTEGNDASGFMVSISGDGRFVAFESDADNLVSGDSNGVQDIFVRDRETGETERVSVASDGTQGNNPARRPSVSADGRFVAFHSMSDNLVPGDSTIFFDDVFVRDRETDETERVSVASDGTEGNQESDFPSVSADGRFVAFESSADNLVSGDSNGADDVFVHDRVSAETERVSVASDGTEGNGRSFSSAIAEWAPDVAFQSKTDNLVSGDSNGVDDVFVHRFRAQSGYVVLDAVGGIHTFGDAGFHGSLPGLRNAGRNIPARGVDLATTRSDEGYFLLDTQGGIHTFGDAGFHGSLPGLRDAGRNIPASGVDLAVSASGNGYFVLDSQGGIHTFGDAGFHGSLPGLRAGGTSVPGKAVDMAVTPDGNGYWVLTDRGGVWAFGTAEFFGDLPDLRSRGASIAADATRMAASPSGGGYYLLDEVGGIHTFGDAEFIDSLPGLRNAGRNIPARGMDLAVTPSNEGYLLLDALGGIHTFGDANFVGSLPGLRSSGTPVGSAPSIRLDTVTG